MSHKFNPTAIACLVFLIAAAQATAAFNNYSMLFDGTNEYVNVLDSDDLSFGNGTSDSPFSVSAWCYRKVGSIEAGIIGKDELQPNREWGFMFYSDGNVYALLYDQYNANYIYRYGVDTLATLNNWHLLTMTYDGSGLAAGIKIFIDTTQVNTTSAELNYTAMHNTTIPLKIGQANSDTAHFNGNIDEVSIWNKALSSNEVSEIYNNGSPGNLLNHSVQTNLVSWWRMGDGGTWDGTNWSIPDLKGTNTGISTNMEYSDRSQEVPPAPIPSGTTFMAR